MKLSVIFLFFLICKVQSSVFMHIVHICICFTEQLNNNKYDVNGGYCTFHTVFVILVASPFSLTV